MSSTWEKNPVCCICNYLWEAGFSRRTIHCVHDVVKQDTGNVIVKQQHGVNSVVWAPIRLKPAEDMLTLWRTTPVQEPRRLVQGEAVNVNVQQLTEPDQRQLFPHPPTQRFQPPVVPPVETRKVQQRSPSRRSFNRRPTASLPTRHEGGSRYGQV